MKLIIKREKKKKTENNYKHLIPCLALFAEYYMARKPAQLLHLQK